MTEEEAKTKWCFHFIASHNDPRQPQSQYGIEQGEPGPFVHHCIGSACMAWRTASVEHGPVVERVVAAPGSKRPDGDDWGYEGIDPSSAARGGEWVRWAPGVVHGFCGLAGAPA